MHEEDIDFDDVRVNGKGLDPLTFFALEEKAVHARVGFHLVGGRYSALKFHGLAAVGEFYVPSNIIVPTPVT
jgi:hypothetical protein